MCLLHYSDENTGLHQQLKDLQESLDAAQLRNAKLESQLNATHAHYLQLMVSNNLLFTRSLLCVVTVGHACQM